MKQRSTENMIAKIIENNLTKDYKVGLLSFQVLYMYIATTIS